MLFALSQRAEERGGSAGEAQSGLRLATSNFGWRGGTRAGKPQSDLRLATSNYRSEGRGGSRAARIRSSERFAARDEQLSAGGEGRGGTWAKLRLIMLGLQEASVK